ncbi:unnamed protein product [Cuscuta europaea]|uniref:Dof zinc finger protein n=1 Tax=Cuscuta europaea TaxID=41803 RepID=A0A9P0YKR1_CUSEU|nr:unnamed protein product [Cuscuta europaea]
MAFSSVPLYLDPPNWPNHHQQQGDGVDGATGSSSLLVPPLPPPPGGGPVRPGSMTERARLAKIPLPDAALKCPRCDSNNTKFCYFNNYSLSQPRHFCKTCRRYWTRGGALRNVPVGGGCRRNKRSSKVSRSKSPARGEQQSNNGGPLANSNRNANITRAGDMLTAHLPPQPPFLQSVSGFAATPDLGLHYIGGNEMEFQEGNNSATAVNLSARFADLFRLQQGMTQQLPYLSGLDQPPPGGCFYQFEEAGADQYGGDQLGVKGFESGGTAAAFLLHHHHHHQSAAGNVKMEDNNMNNGMNISRNFLGISGNNNNDNFWTGNNNINGYTTTDLLPAAAGYASSTTSRLL